MEQAQLIKAFTATVQASLHGLDALERLLEQEQQVLASRDAEALEQLAREKLSVLKQLQHSIDGRDRLQQTAGLKPGLDDGGRLVDALQQATLTRQWSGLLERTRRVAELNDINGRLVSQGQRSARTAIGILTGRPDRQDTYSTLRHGRRAAAGYSRGKV